MRNDQINIAAVRKRAAAATPGPWLIGSKFGAGNLGSSAAVISGKLPPIKLDPHRNGASDAAFIAHARQDVPALLAELDRAMDGWRAAVDHAARIEKELARQRDGHAGNAAQLVSAFESLIQDSDGSDLDPATALVVGKVRRVFTEATTNNRPKLTEGRSSDE